MRGFGRVNKRRKTGGTGAQGSARRRMPGNGDRAADESRAACTITALFTMRIRPS